MRLTKTTSHAVRILLDCAAAGDERIKVAGIAERLDITQLNVFKIVHLLSRAGFLEATRGRNGGVRLARPADEIHIGEIVRAMETTDVEVAGHDTSKKQKTRDPKPQLNNIFDDALEAFITVLDRHSLADLSGLTRSAALPIEKPPAKTGTSKPRAGKITRRTSDQKRLSQRD